MLQGVQAEAPATRKIREVRDGPVSVIHCVGQLFSCRGAVNADAGSASTSAACIRGSEWVRACGCGKEGRGACVSLGAFGALPSVNTSINNIRFRQQFYWDDR